MLALLPRLARHTGSGIAPEQRLIPEADPPPDPLAADPIPAQPPGRIALDRRPLVESDAEVLSPAELAPSLDVYARTPDGRSLLAALEEREPRALAELEFQALAPDGSRVRGGTLDVTTMRDLAVDGYGGTMNLRGSDAARVLLVAGERTIAETEVEPGKHVATLVVHEERVLAELGSIRLRVVSTLGPARSVWVWIGNRRSRREMDTDAQGRIDTGPLAGGAYHVEVWSKRTRFAWLGPPSPETADGALFLAELDTFLIPGESLDLGDVRIE